MAAIQKIAGEVEPEISEILKIDRKLKESITAFEKQIRELSTHFHKIIENFYYKRFGHRPPSQTFQAFKEGEVQYSTAEELNKIHGDFPQIRGRLGCSNPVLRRPVEELSGKVSGGAIRALVPTMGTLAFFRFLATIPLKEAAFYMGAGNVVAIGAGEFFWFMAEHALY